MQREERQRRRSLDPADFDVLRELGYHLMAVPVELGGSWTTSADSVPEVAEALRIIARADPSLALVCSMHPAVLASSADAREPAMHEPGWREQREWIFATVRQGAFWGPIVSEPDSGGDVRKTRATARPTPNGY
jgi:alkylation response protein AidB-like acyl-CoA dehydrogenase